MNSFKKKEVKTLLVLIEHRLFLMQKIAFVKKTALLPIENPQQEAFILSHAKNPQEKRFLQDQLDGAKALQQIFITKNSELFSSNETSLESVRNELLDRTLLLLKTFRKISPFIHKKSFQAYLKKYAFTKIFSWVFPEIWRKVLFSFEIFKDSF